MRLRPTFDQLAYTPDVGEVLTIAQAVALVDRSRPSAERLAQRVAAELERRSLSLVTPALPLTLRTPNDLVLSHSRTIDGDWICVGSVAYHNGSMGSALTVALQWWWEGNGLRVGWWLVRPAPRWDR